MEEEACETKLFPKVPRPARAREPFAPNDEVAVAPKYAGPYAENRLIDAFANCCSWDQALLVVVPNASEIPPVPELYCTG